MLINIKKKTQSFDYFFQRFENGRCIAPHLPRITTEESAKQFQPRNEGLKVLLINPQIRTWSYPNIEPIGLCYITSVALMDGHKIFPLDLNAERIGPVENRDDNEKWYFARIKEKINEVNPDLIGISSIITQYGFIKKIASLCKKHNPKIPIVLGGGIASSYAEFMLKKLEIDYVITQAGEITFSEFLYRVEKNISMDGCFNVGFKKNDNIVMNDKRISVADGELDYLPWPVRNIWNAENIYKHNPVGHLNWVSKWESGKITEEHKGKYSLSILGTRGCKFNCAYCYKSYISFGYEKRTPKDIVDEMEYLKNKYNISYIHFLDDLFFTDIKWSLNFINELKERKKTTGFEIEYGCTCRTNICYLDKKRSEKENRKHLMELAYESGCRQMCFGVESASKQVLKAIDKSGQTPETIAWAAEEAKKIFGYFDSSFMIGNIGETKSTIIETVEFCKKNNITVETIFFAQSFPGTPYFDKALSLNLIGQAVKGYKVEADDDIIEQYFLSLGESSENVLTNFSETLSNEELIELGAWATTELSSINKRHPGLKRHPHTGEFERKGAVNANFADL